MRGTYARYVTAALAARRASFLIAIEGCLYAFETNKHVARTVFECWPQRKLRVAQRTMEVLDKPE